MTHITEPPASVKHTFGLAWRLPIKTQSKESFQIYQIVGSFSITTPFSIGVDKVLTIGL